MTQENYVTVKIPKDLANLVDKLIENSLLGYRSRTEFIIEIIRDKIIKKGNEDGIEIKLDN